MRLYTIRRIPDEVEYDNAVRIADMLAGLDGITQDQEEYLDLLTGQIEKCDDEHYAIETSDLKPLDRLRFLMEQNGLNGSTLGNLLGHRQLGYAILRGERQLSKTHIRILAKRFAV